jgi:hypothetical protein
MPLSPGLYEQDLNARAPAAMPVRNAFSGVADNGISERGWGPARK